MRKGWIESFEFLYTFRVQITTYVTSTCSFLITPHLQPTCGRVLFVFGQLNPFFQGWHHFPIYIQDLHCKTISKSVLDQTDPFFFLFSSLHHHRDWSCSTYIWSADSNSFTFFNSKKKSVLRISYFSRASFLNPINLLARFKVYCLEKFCALSPGH